jgi:LuxR family maltose regulon positive regulatory protein
MLLTTKLAIPPNREHLVARPRLVERLNQGLHGKLILVSAPLGFGKTTLLVQWLEARQSGQSTVNSQFSPMLSRSPVQARQLAWLALDHNDNDPVRFLAYLVTALQRRQPTIAVAVQSMLQSSPLPTLEVLLTMVINDLVAAPTPLLLVLEDYHVITTTAIHSAITFLVDNLPPTLCLVITSRSDPPFPLSRWRARRDVLEIRARDLRFTHAETADFLGQELPRPLAPAEIDALESRTEGWVAGLQLAALSLQERADVSGFIQAFTGSHTYVLDYLTEEVLQRLPTDVEQFLLLTSILPRLCASLCDHIVGRSGSQVMLEQLERANLFLVPLDSERVWYRYHQLFADALRNRLQQTQPQRFVELHQRASHWFAQNRQWEIAVDHALASGDHALAGRWLEEVSETLLKRGESATLRQWLERLPDTVVRSRPRLCLARATTLLMSHQLPNAEEYLQSAEQTVQANPTAYQQASILSEVTAIRANIALNSNQLSRAIELAQQALASLPADQSRLRGEVMSHLGLAQLWTPDLATASASFLSASRLSLGAGDLYTAVLAASNLSATLFVQGQLRQAVQRAEETLALARERNIQQMPITAMPHQLLAELYYEWNDLVRAADHLDSAMLRASAARNPRTLTVCYAGLARLRAAQQDENGALAALDKADRLAQEHNLPSRYTNEVFTEQVKRWLQQGQVTKAEAALAGRHLAVDDEKVAGREGQYRLLTRLLIIQQEYSVAIALLDRLYASAASLGKWLSVAETLVCKSIAHFKAGDAMGAQATLTQLLQLTQPEGYVRLLVDEGEPMRQLLVEYSARHVAWREHPYLARLLAAFPGASAPASTAQLPSSVPPLVEPLSERELEVLQLVAEGLSDRLIAERLIVVVGTVKRHLNNLYSKLGVHSRTQALACARDLGLIQ